jgi:hypothetical protein
MAAIVKIVTIAAIGTPLRAVWAGSWEDETRRSNAMPGMRLVNAGQIVMTMVAAFTDRTYGQVRTCDDVCLILWLYN